MAATLILNVDDVAAHRYAKTRILQAANYEVVEAGTAAEALKLVGELRPNLVLLDINLPDMSGMDVCRAIKSTRRGSRIVVVHITSTSVGARYETASLEHGADAYLPEPVETQTLLTVIGLLLRLRTTEAGLAQSEERLRLATEAAGIATWEIDLDTGIALWSGELYRMLGYSPDAVRPSWAAWQARIHPEDRERVTAALRKAREAEGVFREEHRIVHADGECYVAPFGKAYTDGDGEPARILGVLVDITERHKAEVERERLLLESNTSREEAERANRLKDQFLASLSHELRTPMHAMLGWIQLMRVGKMKESEREQALDTIERNARLQNQLINELLDVSRAISGKLEIQIGNVDIEEVLLAALASVQPMAQAKRIELSHTLADCAITIPGDASRLQQVLGNLLSNAVKFTPVGGLVKIDCAHRDGQVHITVSDNGEGIAPDLLPHVFEAFRQADSSITRRHGGLGLGLSIVHRLVQLHGGTVRAESPGLGHGSTFTVTLPAAGTTASLFAANAPRSLPATASRLHGLRVLAVDDNEDVLQLMQEMLQWEGASVCIATTAARALQLAAEQRPDLLILDIGMPDMHGYELLCAIRSQLPTGNERLPAIAVTGYASATDAGRAIAAGFQAHLAKPFEMSELFNLAAALAPTAGRRSG